MASKKLLTIFGSTGNQGGSVIDAVLARPRLQEKYSLRGITRDPASSKSKALSEKGVEMVQADLNDVESMKAAVKGSYGVFGMTDFWAVMDKDIEIQQGKNIFEACKSVGVEHYVFSALPYAEKITDGVLKHVDHFDSKAIVAEFVEANKGDMIASFFVPAMFIDATGNARVANGKPTLSMPFPNDTAWPLIDPRKDSGKYIMGLFEGGSKANGVYIHGVSAWVTPKEVVATLSRESGQEVGFNAMPADVFKGIMVKMRGETVGLELTETMLLIGGYSYYGKGAEEEQSEHDRWLLEGAETISYAQWAMEKGPWKFQ